MADAKTATYGTGEIIFNEGDAGDCLYVLVRGSVELRKQVDGGEAVLKTVDKPNEFFGEMALVDGRPRSAAAIAVEPCELLVVTEDVFENMVLSNPRFALTIIKALAARIRSSNSQISDLIETLPRERVTRGMVDFALKEGEKIWDGSLKVRLADMQEWLNSHLGTGISDIETHISRLLKAGTLRWASTSSKTHEHVLLSEDFIRENDRRN